VPENKKLESKWQELKEQEIRGRRT